MPRPCPSRRPLRSLAVTVLVPVALAGCSSSSSVSPAATTVAPVAATTTTTGAASGLTGALTVFAAASLTGSFNAARTALATSDPGLSLTFDYAGSNTLATQIQNGAPADVFASADQANMTRLVSAGLVGTPVVFARNKLEIAVAPGNPRGIAGLADLAKPGVSAVLAAPGVPAGDYTRTVEQQLGISITPKSLEPDVKTALAQVSGGEADATVVYVTDVRAAGAAVAGVAIPDSAQPAITYPIAVVKAGHDQPAAAAFVRSAVSGSVQQALLAQGFLPPT